MAKKRYILALDQGTTSSRAVLFDFSGRAVHAAQREFGQIYPFPGWVEHDPEEIWASQFGAACDVLRSSGVRAEEIAAIGIANQRETALAWDRATGEPLCNAIVWQCRRTADFCRRLEEEGHAAFLRERTGLPPDAYFSASKFRRMLDDCEGARERAKNDTLCLGTVDSFLLWRLTEGKVFATDRTNASRTQLYRTDEERWDEELAALFGVPLTALPEVLPSSAFFGETRLFGAPVPIFGVAGDQQAALFGQRCFSAGDAKCTYGTGCFLLVHTGSERRSSSRGLLSTTAAGLSETPEYALEGSVFIGGAVVQWLRDGLGLISSAAETEALARSVPSSGGVTVVPAFVGLGAPYWDPDVSGTISGLTRGSTRAHIVRAALESIAFQVEAVLAAAEGDLGAKIGELKVDGGASANGFLMQFQSDLLGARLCRSDDREATARGAAFLAGVRAGVWSGEEELRSLALPASPFVPDLGEAERRSLIRKWETEVARARFRG